MIVPVRSTSVESTETTDWVLPEIAPEMETSGESIVSFEYLFMLRVPVRLCDDVALMRIVDELPVERFP